MGRDQRGIPDGAAGSTPATYEAPKIETVLTPEALEREVQYAGAIGTPKGTPGG